MKYPIPTLNIGGDEMKVSCWCYATKRQVIIEGELAGKRQAELLKVTDCEHKDCPTRYAVDCLIGKLREGRWTDNH